MKVASVYPNMCTGVFSKRVWKFFLRRPITFHVIVFLPGPPLIPSATVSDSNFQKGPKDYWFHCVNFMILHSNLIFTVHCFHKPAQPNLKLISGACMLYQHSKAHSAITQDG